jgi:ATP-binding cassette subfamily F protein 3
MLSLINISIQFGERTLFDELTLSIGPHDRIGLVGPNGAGKSTLLKIIAGMQSSDSGRVAKAKAVTAGYLPQDGVSSAGKTLYDEAESAFEDIIAVQAKIEELRQSLDHLPPDGPEYAETLDMFGELHHKLDDLDAYRMRSKVERVLTGLGFSQKDFDRSTDTFSGGWQMRIALAKLLLQEPLVLLLDEPTNHLDLESLQWLEEYLRSYQGAVIIVSHDRAFLDNLTTRTIALSQGTAEEYAGNYSFYDRERGARRELLVARAKNQQAQIKQTQEFIDRFRYKATKARQVQSRIKMLGKMNVLELSNEDEQIHFSFPPPPPCGRIVMELQGVCKRYDDLILFNGLDLRIERGDRIAVVGVNGAGKSTLSRILAGRESIEGGSRIVGSNVVVSYFGQHQADELDPQAEAIQIVDVVAEGEIRKKLRAILGSFLFHGDDVFKRVAVLSGGEKSRLALARMLLAPANFLIMDEPTNHLDMRSKQILQEALLSYEGTYFIVSHDRSFLDPIVTKVLEVQPGSSKIYLGSMTEYLDKKQQESSPRTIVALPSVVKEPKNQESWQEQQQKKKTREKEIRARKRLLDETEKSIARLEEQKESLEETLGTSELYKDHDASKAASSAYQDVQKQLEALYWKWGELSEPEKETTPDQ